GITLSTLLLPFYLKKDERKQLIEHIKDMDKGKRELQLPDKCKELAILAVHPDCQGQGRSSRLVRPFLEKFSKQKFACMLMTNTIRNTEIYKKLGFEVIKDVYSKGSDIHTYYMLKAN
ncbi:MAG: GNAT family N-acetyltransferase, partial [Bacillota bacterium]